MMEWNLRVLEWIQSIRTPFGDGFFSAVTHLGDETILVPVFCILFWCINKRLGYRIGFAFFGGVFTGQMLKVIFCVARPWQLSSVLRPVEGAVEGATGFSFPSGHVTSAVGLYGGIGRVWRGWGRTVPLLALIFLVACSRLYLGVHTPLDVCAALVVGGAALLLTSRILEFAEAHEKGDWIVLAGGALLCLLGLLLTGFRAQSFGGDKEPFLDAYKSVGGGLGYCLAWFVESRYVRFSCKAPLWFQTVKVVTGISFLLLFQQGLKTPLVSLCGEETGHLLRYFVVIFFAIAVYPWLFTWAGRRMKIITS